MDTFLNEDVAGPVTAEQVTAQFDLADQRARRADREGAAPRNRVEAVLNAVSSTDAATGRPLDGFSAASEVLQLRDNVLDASARVSAAVNVPNFSLLWARWLLELTGQSVKNKSGTLHQRMFPPVMAQSIVNAVEGLSLLLVAALSEDFSGLVQHHVPSVLNSLLRLEHAMKNYSNTVHQGFLSHFTRRGETHRIRYRVRSAAHLPKSMQDIAEATDEALARLVLGYRDVVKSCNFADPLYIKALQNRVDAVCCN